MTLGDTSEAQEISAHVTIETSGPSGPERSNTHLQDSNPLPRYFHI